MTIDGDLRGIRDEPAAASGPLLRPPAGQTVARYHKYAMTRARYGGASSSFSRRRPQYCHAHRQTWRARGAALTRPPSTIATLHHRLRPCAGGLSALVFARTRATTCPVCSPPYGGVCRVGFRWPRGHVVDGIVSAAVKHSRSKAVNFAETFRGKSLDLLPFPTCQAAMPPHVPINIGSLSHVTAEVWRAGGTTESSGDRVLRRA